MKAYITGDKESYIEPAQNFFKQDKNEQQPFRLPKNFSTFKDWLHIRIASLFMRFSAFGPSLLIKNPYGLSLYWTMVTSFLVKERALNTLNYSYKANGYPPTHTFTASCDVSDGETTLQIHSIASHHNKEIALSKCLGELLERRFFAVPTKKEKGRMILSSAEALRAAGKDYAHSFVYNRYLPQQQKEYLEFGYNEKDSISWVKGRNISTNTPAWLPAQTTFWEFRRTSRNQEHLIHESTSSGCAGYMTRTGATVRALKELIQRDAFMCYWHTKSSPRKIVLNSIPDTEIQNILAEYAKYKFEIHILDITTDIALPCVAVVAIDRATLRPRFHVTAAAHTDCTQAVSDALREMHSLVSCFDGGNEGALPEPFQPFITPFDRLERIYYLHGEAMLAKVQWFLDGKDISFSSFAGEFAVVPQNDTDELSYLLSLLKNKGEGYEVYMYESRAQVLKTLRYHAVRVTVPKIIPIYLRDQFATLDSDRLDEFAAWKGTTYSPEALLTGVIPPHPFP